MIVGDCPGKQVEGKRSYICWEGNRSGDFIHEIAIGYDGVMFTNTCQFEKPHSEQMREQGLDELAFKISTINPPCIICLGKVAKHEVIKAVDSCNVHPNLYFMDHPSFVLRFNKGVGKYATKLRRILKKYACNS